MQFFKHYHNASDSEFVQLLEQKYGLIRYAHWMKMLELLCGKYDGDSVVIRLTRKEIADMLRIKPSKVDQIVGQFVSVDLKKKVISVVEDHNVARTSSEHNENLEITKNLIIIIDAPILLDLKDRDFKFARADRGQTALRVKSKKEEEDKEEEEERRGDKPPALLSFLNHKIEKTASPERLAFWLKTYDQKYVLEEFDKAMVWRSTAGSTGPFDKFFDNWLTRGLPTYQKAKKAALKNPSADANALQTARHIFDQVKKSTKENPWCGETAFEVDALGRFGSVVKILNATQENKQEIIREIQAAILAVMDTG